MKFIRDFEFSTEKVYDVSSFLSKHPGGVQQIMSGLGNDITQVFDSYHKRQTFERYNNYACTILTIIIIVYNTILITLFNKWRACMLNYRLSHVYNYSPRTLLLGMV